MIAHVVFDLPLEEPFDYLIPEELQTKVMPGVRVKVTLGLKPMTGYVIAVVDSSSVLKIKPLKTVCDERAVFEHRDLAFAKEFCAYYGCTLGEALAVMLRNQPFKKATVTPRLESPHKGVGNRSFLYHCPDGEYAPIIRRLTDGRTDYAIVLPSSPSAMFKEFGHCGLIIVVDEENPSYKQQQSPMYEGREALFMAQKIYGFDLAFISATPSVELMHMAHLKTIGYELCAGRRLAKPVIIDTSTYKYLEKGILSPAARHTLQENINAKMQTVIILNRRGSYSVTRCSDCGHILKCRHCDIAMSYSRAQKKFICRQCTYQLDNLLQCPTCGKSSWKSFGMGIEQVQKELSFLFPTVKVAHYEQESSELPKQFDILIATSAILHFKGKLKVRTVLMVDIDSELNRLDMRSSFKGWSLVGHARSLGEQMLIQTRNPDHHVLKSLLSDDTALFYSEEWRLRQELGFAPFRHCVTIVIRAKVEKVVLTSVDDMYNILNLNKACDIVVSSPEPDVPAKLRDQFRYRILVQGSEVKSMIALIKQALRQLKRSRVIVTLNVNP